MVAYSRVRRLLAARVAIEVEGGGGALGGV